MDRGKMYSRLNLLYVATPCNALVMIETNMNFFLRCHSEIISQLFPQFYYMYYETENHHVSVIFSLSLCAKRCDVLIQYLLVTSQTHRMKNFLTSKFNLDNMILCSSNDGE